MQGILIKKDPRDYIAGVLMFVIGLGAMLLGRTYSVGSLRNMGPGFFPTSLGGIMAFVGIVMVLTAKVARPPDENEEKRRPEWKAWAYILGSIVAFVVLGTYGGFVPASFAVVFISALGDRKNNWRHALLLSCGMVTLAVVVFWWALQLQFPLFSWG